MLSTVSISWVILVVYIFLKIYPFHLDCQRNYKKLYINPFVLKKYKNVSIGMSLFSFLSLAYFPFFYHFIQLSTFFIFENNLHFFFIHHIIFCFSLLFLSILCKSTNFFFLHYVSLMYSLKTSAYLMLNVFINSVFVARIYILIILSFPIHEHSPSLYLFRSSIYFSNVLYLLCISIAHILLNFDAIVVKFFYSFIL